MWNQRCINIVLTLFQTISCAFKIYADFESLLKRARVSDRKIMLHILKNIRQIFPAVLLIKLCVLMIDLASQLFFAEEKNAVYRFIKAILKEINYCKK